MPPLASASSPSPRSWTGRALLFGLLSIVIFTFPHMPTPGLDASWRMALGDFFLKGMQFGHDVVFTYGPLGFLMGKTYYGSTALFHSMLIWQLLGATIFASLIMLWGERLEGHSRFYFYAFFLLFGVTYEDALHMLMITLAGCEILRRSGQPQWRSSFLFVFLLALLGIMKFTNLMLGTFFVLVSIAHELWRQRQREALFLGLSFIGSYLALWLFCGQNILNLTTYFLNSWSVSQGYQDVMGITTPSAPFWKAIIVLCLIVTYLLLSIYRAQDRARAVASGLGLGAAIYLNWKHGFVRADGHMIGFFYCALLPVVALPALLNDAQPQLQLKRWLLIPAAVLCLLGVRNALPPVIDQALEMFQAKIWTNISQASQLPSLQNLYEHRLSEQQRGADMPRTRTIVGSQSIGIIGYDQAELLFNKFNYIPSPVFQSYSAYTPRLAQLNTDFYLSDRAPNFVLLRLNSIDERLPAMDDSGGLYIISHRYTYVHSEKGFQLWKKKIGPFNYTAVAPKALQSNALAVNQPWFIEEYANQYLWINVDLSPSLLGRLRAFLYKPPHVYLQLEDTAGNMSKYRMATPIGQAGFILNPVVQDLMAYISFAAGKAERRVRRITIQVNPEDQKYFAPVAQVKLSTLAPSLGGLDFFTQVNRERFNMFKAVPVDYEAQATPSTEEIDGKSVMVMHAPSTMTFNVPANAREINGQHGFLTGAYTNGGDTNGAEFVIVWSDGKEAIELYRKFLYPVNHPEDRGLKNFHVDLKNISGGRLYFKTLPGLQNNFSWDWTAWTGIEIK